MRLFSEEWFDYWFIEHPVTRYLGAVLTLLIVWVAAIIILA